MNLRRIICVLFLPALLLLCGLVAADETDLIWSTFLGGSNWDEGCGIAMDGFGNTHVTGRTESVNFPTTAGAFDTTYIYGEVFVTKLSATGNNLLYSTFLGGHTADNGYDIAVDDSGNAYITGMTFSSDFPSTPGAFDRTLDGICDAFIAKLNPLGSNLIYATFLGGDTADVGDGIAVDDSGNAYITGYTKSSDFPATAGAFDTIYNGKHDAYVAKLNRTGSGLGYATFLGGSDEEYLGGIAVDQFGNAYITGYTKSSNFPTTWGAFDMYYNGYGDAFVIKLNSMGNALDYGTFLGGSYGGEYGYGVAVNDLGNAYVTGYTSSSNFPTTSGAFDRSHNGSRDVFITMLNAAGSAIDYSTYVGGSGQEEGRAIAVDGCGNTYVTGYTFSIDFPATVGAFDTTYNGEYDVFVAQINASGSVLDYATYLGDTAWDWGHGIAADDSGNAYLIGKTNSATFPTTTGAFDETYNGYYDIFIAKLDLSGYPVPVVLASFNATGAQGFIALNWVTASEVNCHRWEVHRSDAEDGEYARLGELSGHGSTEVAHNYQWVDHQVTPGMTYFYKLKQVDFDGSSWWSHSVSATAIATVPKTYALHQNYPNPFNPSTEISYAIPRDEHVSLKVYNVLGAEVATLVDAHQEADFYTVRWDTGELASGLYFCRLQAGDFGKTVKMVLLK